MGSKPPDAFLSYTRFDDRNDGGAISELRKRLADAVHAVTGKPFAIFQDVDGIDLGEHWPGKLAQLLDDVRFFIPILTPSYFASKACRDELQKFLEAEAERGRDGTLFVALAQWINGDQTEAPLRFTNISVAMTTLRERLRTATCSDVGLARDG